MVPKTHLNVNLHPHPAPCVKVLALHPKNHGGPVRAIVSVEYHGLAIHSLQIMSDADLGPWICWPTCRQRNGGYDHIIRPVNQTAKTAIESTILDAWLVQIGGTA